MQARVAYVGRDKTGKSKKDSGFCRTLVRTLIYSDRRKCLGEHGDSMIATAALWSSPVCLRHEP